MLRVNRFAAAIDMIAAGTSAPIAIAPNAMPANQDGNDASSSTGTIVLRLRAARTPVIECGYRNSASAEPNASVEYPSAAALDSITPSVGASDALNLSLAAPKIA